MMASDVNAEIQQSKENTNRSSNEGIVSPKCYSEGDDKGSGPLRVTVNGNLDIVTTPVKNNRQVSYRNFPGNQYVDSPGYEDSPNMKYDDNHRENHDDENVVDVFGVKVFVNGVVGHFSWAVCEDDTFY